MTVRVVHLPERFDNGRTEGGLVREHRRRRLRKPFTGIAERYRARGAFSATAIVRGVERLAPALWLVDVRWDSLDETGAPAPVSVETYRYLVRAAQPDEPRIVAAVVTG